MHSRAWSTLELSNAILRGHRCTRPRARPATVFPLKLRTIHGPRMFRRISANPERSSTSEDSERARARQEWLTALDCLARISAHHGIDLSVEHLRHAYPLDGASISQALLLRMARDAGLRARSTRLDWDSLLRLGEAYPVLVRLANGNWIMVSGAGEGPNGEEVVSVIDPIAERQHEPLIVAKHRFCANWLGDAILIKPDRAAI